MAADCHRHSNSSIFLLRAVPLLSSVSLHHASTNSESLFSLLLLLRLVPPHTNTNRKPRSC